MNNSPSMRRSRSISRIFALAILALAMTGNTARAQTVTFYFTAQGNNGSTPLTNITVPQGQSFTVSVYYTATPTYATTNVNVFVGYDRTLAEGPYPPPTDPSGTDRKTQPLDNKLTLNGDTSTTSSSAISNINPIFNNFYYDNQLGGAQPNDGNTNTVIRPFGDNLNFTSNVDPNTGIASPYMSATPTHLFDISLKNVSLTSGTQTVSLYDAGSGPDFTSLITDGSRDQQGNYNYVRPGNPPISMLTVTGAPAAAPEPSAVVSLLLGTGLLGLQLWRVRSRLRRTVN